MRTVAMFFSSVPDTEGPKIYGCGSGTLVSEEFAASEVAIARVNLTARTVSKIQ
jgi:hypothetical protein